MGIESELYHFSGEPEPEQPLSRQEELSLRVAGVTNEAIATTARLAKWDTISKLVLEGAINDALLGLHDVCGGRLSTISCVSTVYTNKGTAAHLAVVENGKPDNVLFDTEKLVDEVYEVPHDEALRGARQVFRKAFDMLTSNKTSARDYANMRAASQRFRGRIIPGGSNTTNRTQSEAEINPR